LGSQGTKARGQLGKEKRGIGREKNAGVVRKQDRNREKGGEAYKNKSQGVRHKETRKKSESKWGFNRWGKI